MSGPDVFALQRSGLNEFLFATVGVEANGTNLSLASVFARAGRDPWAEAGLLAQSPRGEAVSSLARTLVGMPTGACSSDDATMVATRLVALLPMRPRGIAPHPASESPRAGQQLRTAVLVAGVALAMVYALLAIHQERPLDIGDAFAPGSVHSPAPARSAGHGDD